LDLGNNVGLTIKGENNIIELILLIREGCLEIEKKENLFIERVEKCLWMGGGLVTNTAKAV